ncbi:MULTISPECIES: hypothetical protein [unclassified Paenibacillus]|uniref:hypothetical protein n=1 Tax=unclassified Paenibacillus TaxID=185978 RepID=UPI000465532A|nr:MULTISPECIES: hypothetical protein [unclassified Paenibacillus]KGP77421.1 hypothetical protein P363_0133470 [Paenibacillus sp. MAEPY1]KGP78672.1 hypothetical protein P364_0127520 [Paenibacillus sp. MAEPY2]OZQ71060.1 hypothetical protein CA599_11015 [Paenibacillus taichungensis]
MQIQFLLTYINYACECATLLLLGIRFFDIGKVKLFKYIIGSIALTFVLVLINELGFKKGYAELFLVISITTFYVIIFKIKLVYALIVAIFLKQIRFMFSAVIQIVLPGMNIGAATGSITSIIIFALTIVIIRYRITFTYLRSEYIYRKNIEMLTYSSLTLCVFDIIVRTNFINNSILGTLVVAFTCIVMVLVISVRLEFSR